MVREAGHKETILLIGYRILTAHVSRQMSMGPTLCAQYLSHPVSASYYISHLLLPRIDY